MMIFDVQNFVNHSKLRKKHEIQQIIGEQRTKRNESMGFVYPKQHILSNHRVVFILIYGVTWIMTQIMLAHNNRGSDSVRDEPRSRWKETFCTIYFTIEFVRVHESHVVCFELLFVFMGS